MGDGVVREAQRNGTVKINSSGTSCIKDVLYAYLDSNLLSVGQTRKNILLKVPMAKNNLFPLTLNDKKKALSASLEDDNWLWYHSVKCILLAIVWKQKGMDFKILSKKLLISRDAMFDEKNQWNWTKIQTSAGYIQNDCEFVKPVESIDDDGGNGGSGSSSPSTSLPHLVLVLPTLHHQTCSSSTTHPCTWRSLAGIYTPTERCQLAQIKEPDSFEEAIKSNKWCVAMDEEMNTLEKNKTWELIDLPLGKEVVGLK
ncbi:hypothetical protein GH714_043640 [Hevea brasiliensis]|uniref:Reverse transcriptase Ty1/copia-type domain-containing protein n=1 Tax=Hevea brasiliensis TaxID=3981 RepID=A0A6A6K4T0_HEVBR|nr:hypothetical protein GH714_043640 [Hevea brasiliensis]